MEQALTAGASAAAARCGVIRTRAVDRLTMEELSLEKESDAASKERSPSRWLGEWGNHTSASMP